MSRKYSLKRTSSDSFHYLLRCLGLHCIFIRSRLFAARLFATTIVAILLCGVASSQNYSIRVTYNTNLRASFSLESAIIETAPAGTTLQVVGSHSRWLRINRNGNDVWMADWVAYTRVEEGVPSQGQTASDIDNCCFVDRQCSSDQEWTDGYWAYQNGQCPAPAQSQTPTSSQPVSGVPAQIDNCCFVDRQCHTDQDWTNGYWAFQNNQCSAPGQSVLSVGQADNERSRMRIEGSADFIALVNASLDLLKARAPHWYDYTVFGLDWILEVPDGTIVSSPTDVNVWLFGQDHTYGGGTPGGFAGVLVHEACHAYQQQVGLASGAGINFFSTGLEAERECLTLEIEALDDCCPGYSALPGLRHTLANIEKPEYQWWHGCDFVWWHGMESECD